MSTQDPGAPPGPGPTPIRVNRAARSPDVRQRASTRACVRPLGVRDGAQCREREESWPQVRAQLPRVAVFPPRAPRSPRSLNLNPAGLPVVTEVYLSRSNNRTYYIEQLGTLCFLVCVVRNACQKMYTCIYVYSSAALMAINNTVQTSPLFPVLLHLPKLTLWTH